jgi:TRAP-type C4-dicarboxylate transport system substrate-binding protein
MKKMLIIGLVLVFALAMGLVACGEGGETDTTAGETGTTVAYAPGTWTFTFNTFFPATNNIAIVGEMWQKEITERTNGAVAFDYLPGASLTAAKDVYDGVVTGISDLGFSVVAYTPGVFPITELLDMPHGYPSGYVATMVANDYYKKFQPAEFKDVQVLAFYGTGPQVVMTTDKPVRKLADAKGLVLRSTGVGATIAGLLGAEGYAAAQNEAYELMSKGTIDGTIAPREVLKGWKQAEVVKYVTQCFSIGSMTTMYLVMNKDKWDELPADIQQIFTETSEKYVEYWANVASGYDYDGIVALKAQPGREVIDLDATEAAAWKAAVRPIIDEKLAALTAAGFTDDYEAYLLERIAYWQGQAPSEEECSTWVKANLAATTVAPPTTVAPATATTTAP